MRLKLATLLVLLSSAAAPQQPPTSTQQPAPKIAVTSTTVVVDVVVRDKSGKPVTDLARDDFEVYEDGVKQDVTSMQVVSSEIPAAPERPVVAPAARGSEAPRASAYLAPTGPAVVALVFDHLSPDARSIALRAGQAYVDEGRASGDFTGVFIIDKALHTIQPYTRDLRALRGAIERATTAATAGLSAGADRARGAEEAQAVVYGNSGGNIAGAESVGAGAATQQGTRAEGREGGAIGGGSEPDRLLAQLQVNMEEAFTALSRDQQGYATTNGLLAVVHSLQGMPGRKTLVFFSEGVAIPPAVEHHFQLVIDAANRANVAIYTLDATGLRVRSTLTETRDQMARDMAAIERNRANGIMMKGMERSEDTLHSIPGSGLSQLAAETGGLYFENTNDLRSGMRKIDVDRHFYYLLGYSPRNEQLDGTYREIAVKVRRSGVEVHARKGYRAIRSTGAMPVLSYEGPALALLDGASVPNAFPVRAGALSFPEPKRPGLTPIVVQVSESAITFAEEKDKKRYAADVSVVARIKDSSDKVVRKLSQRYELVGPIAQLEAARHQEILFYREPELTPGVYTLEAVVYDAIAQRGSVRFATIEVPRVDPAAIQISTLLIVRRSERLSAEEHTAANPLFFGDVVVYPNLGESLRKGTDKELGFAVAIYAASGGAPSAVIEVMQNGRRIGQAGVQLPAPDASGRIQYVGRLPLDNFTPGSYELRLTVTDAKSRQTRNALFRIE